MRHIGGKPVGREDSWRRLLCGVGDVVALGIGPWAVELQEQWPHGRPCRLLPVHREMEPLILGEPEMGWIFARRCTDKG